MCEKALVSADAAITSLGNLQQAYVYSSETGDCAAFLSNNDWKSAAKVMFNNMHYNLPLWSISIIPDCRNVVFNTAKVGVQTSNMEMLPTNSCKQLIYLVTNTIHMIAVAMPHLSQELLSGGCRYRSIFQLDHLLVT
ncbi:beta-galactosidase 3 [Nicotiana attenuata]|uniref:Beta-galactosidase 3 n=1 Tax=Nicotiana attenuata TaxID=49451 RepID=A0A1J6JER7_NICAT|nr:beta-galactosidase 3 [Nicotiana attenuata]